VRHPVPERVGVGLDDVLRQSVWLGDELRLRNGLGDGLRLCDGLEVAEGETETLWTLKDGDAEPEEEKEEASEEESLGLAEPDPESEPPCSTLRTALVRRSTPGPPFCAAALLLLSMPVAGGVGIKPSAGKLAPEPRCATRPGA